MLWSALFGMIFGLIAYGAHLKGIGAVIGGLVYGVLAMLLMNFVVLPLVGAPNLSQMLGWLSINTSSCHLLSYVSSHRWQKRPAPY
jgi:hypothetical protein